ncbi:pre-mRNA splicing protein [Theileria orientalis]|uniref:Pre-mRNA-splicing factor 18 n=1 Tax=Theileria orientalis TaxID=68886 RepID=A0A976MAY5_THEOR|nr:pre-mRNA splicing protein [Theileria orientalis]
MDKLLSTIKKKRDELKELKGDKKWIKTSEESEKRRLEAQEQLERQNECKKRLIDEKLKKIEEFYDKKQVKDEDKVYDRTNDIPVEEVVKRLRKLRQPATLFGESHKDRCERLFSQETDVDDLEASQNIYVDAIMGRNNYLISKYINKNVTQVDFFDDYKDLPETSKHYRYLIHISFVLRIFHWVSQMLRGWEQQMMDCREDLVKEGKEFEAKKNEAMLVQTKKDITPLLKLIKSKKLDEDILDKLFRIVECCEKGEFKEAHDAYMLLAIGNAAWPMGVTMVGIHERAGRSKIFTSEVAHILNDETTRKYIQMFKRLISFAQTKFGKDPSKILVDMTSREDQNKSSNSSQVLSPKDASVFKNMMELYTFKNYKKALKIAESLLAKYPEHGETLSVKALLLLFIDPTRENEIIEIAKRGLRNGINSYMCWHVLGVIYKHVKKYRETAKCFIMALKLDPHNDRLLKEICCLEIELRDYSAFRRFASTQLKLKSKEYREWMLFAFSQHLCGNLASSCEILEEADKLFSSDYRVEDYELSESIMYRAMVYEHLGEFEKCASLLEQKANLLKDKMTYLELRAKALYMSKNYQMANNIYRQLLDLNPNNARFVFMLFLTHNNENVRNMFLLQFSEFEKPKRGSIYDEKLKNDSKNFVEKTVKVPEDHDYPIVLSNEILDMDGEYSAAGWHLEHRLYHNFDMYMNAKSSSGNELYRNCYSFEDYALNISMKLDLSDLPDPGTMETIEEVMQTVDDYLSDYPGSDLVVYCKYRRPLKRDTYPLFMFTRSLEKKEEEMLLETLDGMNLKDPFIYNSFVFTFTSGMNFYRRAQKYIIESLNRGSTNIIRSFLHCLTFKKAYILVFVLSGFKDKLSKHQRIDNVKNDVQVKWSDHLISCNYRAVLTALFLAKIYDFMGSYYRALDVLNMGLEIAPTSVDLLCVRGKVYKHLGDLYSSNDDYCMAGDIDRSDRQTSAKSAKSILRTFDFDYSVTKWKSFLTEDVCKKNEKEAPPEIPSFKFELMYAKFKSDLFLKSSMYCDFDHQCASEQLKESFDKYRYILDKHSEIYENQLDFHNYCLNRLSYRVYYNFLKLRSVYCAQGYFIKALKGAIRCSIQMHHLGIETELTTDNVFRNKNIAYCVKWMKTVLNQRVYDPGLFGLFYYLASICDMDLLFRLRCITHCYYSSRCNKLNGYLIQMIYHLISYLDRCSTFEMDLVRKTLDLCVHEDLFPKTSELNGEYANLYLDFVMEEILETCYNLKQVKGLILCAYNYRTDGILERIFENYEQLYRHITFKDYLKFKRFLLYAVHSCRVTSNKDFLRRQIEVLNSECSGKYTIDLF